jgi:hypothetical protein
VNSNRCVSGEIWGSEVLLPCVLVARFGVLRWFCRVVWRVLLDVSKPDVVVFTVKHIKEIRYSETPRTTRPTTHRHIPAGPSLDCRVTSYLDGNKQIVRNQSVVTNRYCVVTLEASAMFTNMSLLRLLIGRSVPQSHSSKRLKWTLSHMSESYFALQNLRLFSRFHCMSFPQHCRSTLRS